MPSTANINFIRKLIIEDHESESEVYQTIFYAALAAYESMFERGCLTDITFRVLEKSIEFGLEAVNGELRESDTKSLMPDCKISRAVEAVEQEDYRQKQTELSLSVSYESLKKSLIHGLGLRWKFDRILEKYVISSESSEGADVSRRISLLKNQVASSSKRRCIHVIVKTFAVLPRKMSIRCHSWLRHWSLIIQYRRMKIAFETVMAYFIVNETFLGELPVFEDFAEAKESVNQTLNDLIFTMLLPLYNESSGIFVLLENLLAAKLSILNKKYNWCLLLFLAKTKIQSIQFASRARHG